MAIHMPRIIRTKQIHRASTSNSRSLGTSMVVPKGHLAVYVGEEEKKRFVVPVWLLNQPSFLDFLQQAEDEYGYHHPMGGLTIPCTEEMFIDLASRVGAI